eukprot:4079887-Prymnesium_polylepis.1
MRAGATAASAAQRAGQRRRATERTLAAHCGRAAAPWRKAASRRPRPPGRCPRAAGHRRVPAPSRRKAGARSRRSGGRRRSADGRCSAHRSPGCSRCNPLRSQPLPDRGCTEYWSRRRPLRREIRRPRERLSAAARRRPCATAPSSCS